MPQDYSLVNIGGVWLTDDGTETGGPCRVLISGLNKLRLTRRGANTLTADGSSVLFTAANEKKGIDLIFNVAAETHEVLEDLYDAINALLDTDDDVQITITGDEGDFDVNCHPLYQPDPIEYDPDVSDGVVNGLVIRMRTRSSNA